MKNGESNSALEILGKAVDIYCYRKGERSVEYADALTAMANAQRLAGNFQDAYSLYQQVLEISAGHSEELSPDSDDEIECTPSGLRAAGISSRVAMAHANIALVNTDLGDYDRAMESHMLSLQMNKSTNGLKHPDTAVNLNNIASLYCLQADYDKALEHYQGALEIYKEVSRLLDGRSALFPSEAPYLFFSISLLTLQVFGDTHDSVADCMSNIGNVLEYQGKHHEALKLYRNAKEVISFHFISHRCNYFTANNSLVCSTLNNPEIRNRFAKVYPSFTTSSFHLNADISNTFGP